MNAILKLRKSTDPLFDATMTIESWKPKESLFVAKSSGYNNAVTSGQIRKINVQHPNGTVTERYALTFGGKEITSGNCTAINAETGEIAGNYLFNFAQQGIVLKGNTIVDAPFGPSTQVAQEPELPY